MIRLSHTQRKVFCALNAYPEYNDRQIADLLCMQRSTVTIARHYLEKNNLYTISLFPNFEKIPISLIGIIYGDYSKLSAIDYKKRMDMRPKELHIAEYVFSYSSEHKGVSMCFADSLSTLKAPFDAWTALFKSADPTIHIEQCYFPREMVKAYKFMHSPKTIAGLLDVAVLPQKKKNKKIRIMRKKEKEVLLAWMQYPTLTNEELSEKTKLSRAAIGSIKKRLLHYELVQMVQLPNWYVLGLNLGVLLHLQYHPKDLTMLSQLEELPETVFLVATSYELIAFSLFKDYDSYQKKMGPIIQQLQREKLLTAEAKEILFPLSESKYSLNAFEFLQKIFFPKQ